MQSMNISLPDPLKQFVDRQIAQGRYSSASEYMRELIRADEKSKAEDQLEAKLLQRAKACRTTFKFDLIGVSLMPTVCRRAAARHCKFVD